MKYRCVICNYIYDEESEEVKFNELSSEWLCPECGVPTSEFEKVEEITEE